MASGRVASLEYERSIEITYMFVPSSILLQFDFVYIRYSEFHATMQTELGWSTEREKPSNAKFSLCRFVSCPFCSDEHFIFVSVYRSFWPLMAPGAWVHLQTKTKLNYVYESTAKLHRKTRCSCDAGKVFCSVRTNRRINIPRRSEKKWRKKSLTKPFFFLSCSPFPFWFREALCVSALIVELFFSLAVAPSLWRHFPLAVKLSFSSIRRSFYVCDHPQSCLSWAGDYEKKTQLFSLPFYFSLFFFFFLFFCYVVVDGEENTFNCKANKNVRKGNKQKVIINEKWKKTKSHSSPKLIFSFVTVLFCYTLHFG